MSSDSNKNTNLPPATAGGSTAAVAAPAPGSTQTPDSTIVDVPNYEYSTEKGIDLFFSSLLQSKHGAIAVER